MSAQPTPSATGISSQSSSSSSSSESGSPEEGSSEPQLNEEQQHSNDSIIDAVGNSIVQLTATLSPVISSINDNITALTHSISSSSKTSFFSDRHHHFQQASSSSSTTQVACYSPPSPSQTTSALAAASSTLLPSSPSCSDPHQNPNNNNSRNSNNQQQSSVSPCSCFISQQREEISSRIPKLSSSSPPSASFVASSPSSSTSPQQLSSSYSESASAAAASSHVNDQNCCCQSTQQRSITAATSADIETSQLQTHDQQLHHDSHQHQLTDSHHFISTTNRGHSPHHSTNYDLLVVGARLECDNNQLFTCTTTTSTTNAHHSEQSRPTTSNTGIVEHCAENADPVAADQGPPAKKAKIMQAGVQQSSSKSVGQRLKESTLKESLQTSKNPAASCRSPVANDYASTISPVSPRSLSSTQVNTIRVIGQYLKNLGMQETVATLFAESGCRLEDSLAVRLRECALNGEWDLALHIVGKMSPYVSRTSLLRIRVKLLEEKFVELLTKDQTVQALRLLSVDYPSDDAFADRRNFLATLLYVDPNTIDIYSKTGAHRDRQERSALVSNIQQLLPTSVMLPPSRLEKLLKQSWKMQARECYLHMAEQRGPSPDFILEDHQCSWEDFPLFTSQVLNNHQDEVWCASFSPGGNFLATGAKCGPTLVWKVVNERTLEPYKSFGGSQNTAVICWSDDSKLLAVASAEDPNTDVHVYDVHRGAIYCTLDNRGNDNTVLSFFAGNQPYKLVCADQKGHFCQYVLSDNSAKPSGKFEGYRIRAIHCLRNGTVIAADTHNRVRRYRFSDDFDQTLIQEQSQIINFVVDKLEQHILIDTKLHGLRLWDLESSTLLHSYTGAPHHDFVVFSTFGGLAQDYIATGSVDSKVYIWSYKSDRLIAKLSGHTGKVNAVAWNPTYPQILVSCSDDGTIRVWTPFNGDVCGAIGNNSSQENNNKKSIKS